MAAPRRRQRALPAALLAVAAALGLQPAFVPPPARGQPALLAALAPLAAGCAMSPAAWAGASEMMATAPSGVNALPESEQALRVLLAFAVIAFDTAALVALFGPLRRALPEGWFDNWQKTWPILGAFYMLAGSAHFTAAEAFESIYPPPGTWGFWYLPGSAQFHVAWTGVAELAGGAGLFLGALGLALADSQKWEVPALARRLPAYAALGLFLLTIVVTPANVYMYTHGAQMVGLTPGDAAIPVEFHYVRGALQSVLLGILWSYYQAASSEADAKAKA